MAPNATPDLVDWAGRRGRAALSPRGARDLILMNSKADVRDALPLVQAPTLVLHRTGDRDANVEEGRYIAERIPGARFVELPGDDHIPLVNPDQILDEVEEFLTGAKPAPVSERVLATVLFTDLVGSTERARELGDRAGPSCSSGITRSIRRELARFGCEEIDTAGDGFLALGEGPTSTIRCALSIVDAVGALGSERPRRRAHRRGGASAAAGRRAASPYTSARASPRQPARTRCSSARRRATSSPARASSSRTAASSS